MSKTETRFGNLLCGSVTHIVPRVQWFTSDSHDRTLEIHVCSHNNRKNVLYSIT